MTSPIADNHTCQLVTFLAFLAFLVFPSFLTSPYILRFPHLPHLPHLLHLRRSSHFPRFVHRSPFPATALAPAKINEGPRPGRERYATRLSMLTSGFVGSAVASAFVRAGHIVYGQTRSKDTGERMAAQEIFPVVCDPFSEGDIWAKVAKDVDVRES